MEYGKSYSLSIETGIRSTPKWFFDYWNRIFRFDLDVCANKENAKCGKFYTEQENGLEMDWMSVNWCNPPYSRGNIKRWLLKGIEEQKKGNTTVFLLPCDMSTSWYHELIKTNQCHTVIPVIGRIVFNGMKSGSPFGSIIVIFWGDLRNTTKRQ